MERFDLRKLNDAEVKDQCQVRMPNRFAPFENLDDDDDDDDGVNINRAWKSIRDCKSLNHKSLGYYVLKQHKTCFDEECSKLLDQRKQAKLQWLQNPSQINGDDLNSKT
jgi:hypothetical protein